MDVVVVCDGGGGDGVVVFSLYFSVDGDGDGVL